MKSNTKFFKKSKKLPVDEFFKNVLYDNKFGYYTSKLPFGKKGDFITSPNISYLFSEIIAIWIISAWELFGKPKNFSIVELGPGDGSLTNILLRSFKKFPEFNSIKKIFLYEESNYSNSHPILFKGFILNIMHPPNLPHSHTTNLDTSTAQHLLLSHHRVLFFLLPVVITFSFSSTMSSISLVFLLPPLPLPLPLPELEFCFLLRRRYLVTSQSVVLGKDLQPLKMVRTVISSFSRPTRFGRSLGVMRKYCPL